MKKLLFMLSTLMLLSGCQAVSPVNIPAAEKVVVVETFRQKTLDQWLLQIQTIMLMNSEQLQQQLKDKAMVKPVQSHKLFRYAVLNQQLKDRLGWIRARDSLREIKKDPSVKGELVTLIDLLLLHNQSMINADARESRLHEALSQGQNQQQKTVEALQQSYQQTLVLEKKIEALTSLERNMSIRRALTTDAPKEQLSE